MSENIKNNAITAAGYVYQNRQGLKVLCDWLDAPARYSRVKFECDNENEAPQGLDDIVIERSDGLLDLQQVKFTPDPDVHLLSWDWMLEKSGKTERSRSMLRKWFDAFKKLNPALIGELSLRTNRRPDAAIEACLDADKISFSKVPEPKRSEVIAELGSADDCEAFFSQLRIRHSDKGYVTLEQEVDARLRPHGTPEGIAILKNVALNWATQKNFPAPDGWVTLMEVRTILRASPPAPLPEDFIVPKGYEVPDEAFHQEFVQDAINAVGKVFVLTGPPGRGKSTYLSSLCDTLTERDIPVVRHHYFLSTTERGRDRVNSYVVEQSIQAQVEQFHEGIPKMAGGLRALLEACGSYYKALGKPFMLVLDGLDHVWRINAEDKRPLDDLFSQVIPCPDNVVLLVGTQPVDDAQLPTDLLASAPKAEWRTLPAMSENAVLSYLRKAVQEGRLTTGFEDEQQSEEQLQGAASALRSRTNGHPLHVIYATAELEHGSRKLSSWEVEQLKGDLSKDAKFYYASLWGSLLPSLKDTLRLVCAFPFFWPKTAFAEIAVEITAASPDVGNVEHLLHSSVAGLKVFHESLAVFVRATADYEDRIKQLMPAVANWLERSAPTSLRVNWLWTVQAKLGDPENLIKGLTRDWIMLRLEEGYPESLFDTLLSEALVEALETAKFSDAYRLAHLKARMVDGSKFQMQSDDLARLISFTLTLAEEGVVREASASRHETDILRVVALGLALRFRGDQMLAETCGEEALRRFRGLSRFSSRYVSRVGSDEFKFLVGGFARLGVIGVTPTALAGLASKNDPAVWLPRVRMLVEEGNLDDLMVVVVSLSGGKNKNVISDACIRAAAKAGASIAERDDFHALARTPFVAAVEAALTRTSKPLSEPIPVDWVKGDYYERKENLAELAHHWFFSAVHLGLCMAGENQSNFEYTRALLYEDRENISDFLNVLSDVGAQVAHHWWRGEFVDFHELFVLLEPVEFQRFRQSYDRSSAAEDFRRALHSIACDIRLGSILLSNIGDGALTKETLMVASQCRWFDSASFRTQYTAGSLTRMTDDAAAAFVQSQRSLLDDEVWEETSGHLQTPLQLCAIALTHNLMSEARELCKQTWELATGYGHRKDPLLGNTIEAIGYLVEVAAKDARRLLGRIAPQIHHVLNYTDGKGTRHVLAETDGLLAKLKPSALVVKYEEHAHAGDWSEAEDSLQAYVERGTKDGWPLDALMRTGLHAEIHNTLQRLARDGNVSATERVSVLQGHSGLDVGFLERQEHTGSDVESKPYEGDITTFEPERLNDLLQSLSPASHNERASLLRAWYQHWAAKGQGKRLLDTLEGLLLSEEGRQRDVLVLSDLAFQTKRKLSGAKAAWKYLVRAQILSGGWIGYMESETKTRNRLDLVAQSYPQRCDEFVVETTYSMFDEPAPPRVAPNDVMVYFYARQGRLLEAVQFAETMVDCVIEDTRTLPLRQPRWAAELASPFESASLTDELHILIARLGWPSASARWWTMQELAVRLGDPAVRGDTESALLQLLRSRKLEAEAVEVVSIFWMAAKGHGYAPTVALAENILKPSLLSDLLVVSLGLSVENGNTDQREVPEGFEIPDDFDGVQGVDLPRIFRTTMSRLEAYSGLPFVRQMAFEWSENRATYPGAPYQGDLWHFTRPLGDDFVGSFSARAALRAISAYLRALAVAKQIWNMPPRLAEKESLLALPIHPTLALLRPWRPEWFPTSIGFDGDTEAVETALRALIARVEHSRPGGELIAFNSPVVISMERCVEVSLVRWSQAEGSIIDDADLAAYLKAFWAHEQLLPSATPEPISTTTIVIPPALEQLMDDDCKAWPLAGTLDFFRMGYLQRDLYPSRLYFPTLPGSDEFRITPLDGQLEVKVEDQVVADFCYWNAGWGPALPRQLRGNCGTALVSQGTAYREGTGPEHGPLRAFYLWQVRTLHRSSSFGEFSETLATGTIFV